MVFCTDGVTEFLSNQNIVAVCDKNDDPLDACEEIVQTAFAWFVDDAGWADDITVVVMKLHWPTALRRPKDGTVPASPRAYHPPRLDPRYIAYGTGYVGHMEGDTKGFMCVYCAEHYGRRTANKKLLK